MRVSNGYVLIVEDDPDMNEALREQLESWDYEVKSAVSAAEALRHIDERLPDLIISDVNIEGDRTGIWICEQVRMRFRNDYIPFILMTGSFNERVAGLKSGADDFLTKPFDPEELAIRVKSLVRIREHLGRLRRFFSPQIADLIVSDQDNPLVSHRRDVTVVFVDLRGFTAFSERALPEDVMRVLNEYYAEVGRLTLEFRGTLGHIAGDGIMVFFNDPVAIENHELQALKMVQELRKVLALLEAVWAERGFKLSYGIGVSSGVATIGAVGFREFWEYTVIGHVPNLASRLCEEAGHGEVLMCENFANIVGEAAAGKSAVRSVTVKGIEQPVTAFVLPKAA